MRYEKRKVFDIIDEVVLKCVNNESSILGVTRENVVTPESMRGKDRHREFVISRQLCQYFSLYIFDEILREKTSKCYIGKEYKKDHATVLHSVTTIKNLMDTSKQVLYMVASCMNEIISRVLSDEIYHDADITPSMMFPAYY